MRRNQAEELGFGTVEKDLLIKRGEWTWSGSLKGGQMVKLETFPSRLGVTKSTKAAYVVLACMIEYGV